MNDPHPDELMLLHRWATEPETRPEWLSAYASSGELTWLDARNAAEHDAMEWALSEDFEVGRFEGKAYVRHDVNEDYDTAKPGGSGPTPLLAIVAAWEAGK